jgi:hypothetical protein
MKTRIPALLALCGVAIFSQPTPKPAALPILTLHGSIRSVNLTAGGMPSIVVKDGSSRQWTVRLGSIRYLIAQDFNPRAGEIVNVRGYGQESGEVIAISVECPQTGKKITLRGEDGRPLWRGGGR